MREEEICGASYGAALLFLPAVSGSMSAKFLIFLTSSRPAVRRSFSAITDTRHYPGVFYIALRNIFDTRRF